LAGELNNVEIGKCENVKMNVEIGKCENVKIGRVSRLDISL
jgi:hypothetical protein